VVLRQLPGYLAIEREKAPRVALVRLRKGRMSPSVPRGIHEASSTEELLSRSAILADWERHVQIVEVFQNLKMSMKLVTVAEPARS
jgi:hypothetical protein